MGKKNHLLIIALIANEIFNNIILLGISLRIIVLLVLTVIALKSVNLRKLQFNKYLLSLYFLYVLVTTIATFFSGNFTFESFSKRFFGYYTITLLYTIIIPNINLNIRSYNKIVNFILFVAISHYSLIILQFLQYDLFWTIPDYFSDDFIYIGNGIYNFSAKLNQNTPVGLIDNSVAAGYIILVLSPCYNFINKNIYKLFYILIIIVSTLFLGQRSVLLLLIVYLFFDQIIFISKINLRFKKLFFGVLFLLAVYFFMDTNVYTNEISYKFQEESILEDENRFFLLVSFISFASSNFLFGGVNEYFTIIGDLTTDRATLPHNLFLNSFVIGGVFSFLFSIWLFISYFKFLWKNYVNSTKPKTFSPLFMSSLLIMLNSLFHNQGFSINDNLFFLIFAISNIKVYHDS